MIIYVLEILGTNNFNVVIIIIIYLFFCIIIYRRKRLITGVEPGFPETDVTLIVEDQKIHVNKAVLCEHSPVFGTMFMSQFKERSAKEITLVDKKAADVVEFLKSFYPNMNHPINSKANMI